jgi:hypothetical protein
MSSRRQVVSAGIVGLILAVALIIASAYFLPSPTTTGTSSQVNSSTQLTGGQGTIDVLLTDPPNVPTGVTAVYVTYSSVAVHVNGAGNRGGWTNSNTVGTIDLMKLVNISTTIASIKVTTGVYNALRFNISSAAVTFDGRNYTAFVPRALLTVLIPGGLRVNATTSSAEIIDMSPTVLNIGSGSTPEFIISMAASCFRMPQSVVVATNGIGRRGFILGLSGTAWWNKIRESYTANVTIGGASLSASSFSVTVKNTGSTSLNLNAIFITPIGYECAIQTSTSSSTSSTATTTTASSTATTSSYSGRLRGNSSHGRVPDCITGSATFLVQSNGTLLSVKGLLADRPILLEKVSSSPWSLFGKIGLTFASGGSVTLAYSGPISFGVALPRQPSPPGVNSGDQYDITVVGSQALAQMVVTAS